MGWYKKKHTHTHTRARINRQQTKKAELFTAYKMKWQECENFFTKCRCECLYVCIFVACKLFIVCMAWTDALCVQHLCVEIILKMANGCTSRIISLRACACMCACAYVCKLNKVCTRLHYKKKSNKQLDHSLSLEHFKESFQTKQIMLFPYLSRKFQENKTYKIWHGFKCYI